jgi:hypothetical protein
MEIKSLGTGKEDRRLKWTHDNILSIEVWKRSQKRVDEKRTVTLHTYIGERNRSELSPRMRPTAWEEEKLLKWSKQKYIT